METTDLPELVQDLIARIGIGETIALMKSYGGSDIFIPKTTTRYTRLSQTLKPESIEKLVAVYGGEKIEYLPKLDRLLTHRRNVQIHQEKAIGMSIRQIAKKHKLSRRWVQVLLKHPAPSQTEIDKQLPLF